MQATTQEDTPKTGAAERAEPPKLNDTQKAFLSALEVGNIEDAERALDGLSNKELLEAFISLKRDRLVVSKDRFLDACAGDEVDVVHAYIEQGGDIEARDYNGRTGLQRALWDESWEVATALVDAGADLSPVDDSGLTVLHMALAALRRPGAPVDLIRRLITPQNFDAETESGFTPLCQAARDGRLNVIHLLLEVGANPNHKKPDGWTPLMLAICNQHFNVARELMRLGAKLELPPEEEEEAANE